MNRRITKTMAGDAADIMKDKVFSQKLQDTTAKINAAVEILVRKHLPWTVIAVVNEYPKYFYKRDKVYVSTLIEKDGYTTHASYISGTISFPIPNACGYLTVSNTEYEALDILERKRKLIIEKSDKFGQQIYEALLALKTEKAVQEELPEALKYLKFPDVKALPMQNYEGLRNIISHIQSREG